MKSKRVKISVLLDLDEFEQFDAYCKKQGFKKSTLIARLIQNHIDENVVDVQRKLPTNQDKTP